MSLIPGLGRFPEEGNGNPLQYSCLGNPTDRGAWRAIVCGVTKSQTRLSNSTMTAQIFSSVSQTAVPGSNLLEDIWLKEKKKSSSMVKHSENLHPNFSLSPKTHNTFISAAFEKSHKKGSGVLLFNPISQTSTYPPHCCQRNHL